MQVGALGGSQAVIWVILEAAGRILVPLGALWEPLGEVLGASWKPLGTMLGAFGRCLETISELGKYHEGIC